MINSTGSMGETMRRHVAERGRKAMEKEGGVTTDDLKNDMKRLMSLMDTSEEVAEAQKQVRHPTAKKSPCDAQLAASLALMI